MVVEVDSSFYCLQICGVFDLYCSRVAGNSRFQDLLSCKVVRN